MITYQPSPHFKQSIRDLDDYLAIRWIEETETLEIWSALPNKRPIMEHQFERGNKARERDEKPLYNWDMEWIVLGQLVRARRFQHMSATEFQNDMLDRRERIKVSGERTADAKYTEFLSDSYWHKKQRQELNNDFGKCTTLWAGSATPEGK